MWVPGLRSFLYQPMTSGTHTHDGIEMLVPPLPPAPGPSRGAHPPAEKPNPGEPAVLWRSLQDDPRKVH